MRRGITPVVAIALLMGMTVVASGGAYAFFTTATESAMADTTASLQTSTEVRDIQCTDTSVTVAISNTGDRELATDAATAYLYRDGDLVDTVEKDLSGANVLQPGGFSQLEFPFTTYLSPGTGYEVEVSFENMDHTIERPCQAQTGSLVGYWNFDSIDSRTILDAVGENDGTFYGMELNGTFTGMQYNGTLGGGSGSQSSDPAWETTCHTGKCLDFDGSDDYVDVADVQLTGSELTISAWVITVHTSPGNWPGIFGDNAQGGNQIALGQWKNGQHPWLEIQTTDGNFPMEGEQEISTSEWTHVAMVYNGSRLIEYVNGKRGKSISASGNLTGWVAGSPKIAPYVSQHWKGKIDDVRVYNRSLSRAEITEVMNGELVTDSLIAYYPMDEGSGQTVYNNAFQAEGQHGQAVSFDGIDDHVSIGDLGTGTLQKWSVSFWAEPSPSQPEEWVGVVSSGDASNEGGWSLHINSNEDDWVVSHSGDYPYGNGLDLSAPISYGSYQHMAWTYDGNEMKVYKNGNLIDSVTGSQTYQSGMDDLVTGRYNWQGDKRYSNVSLDDIRIYNRALPQSEIQADMNGGAPQEGIVAYYSMDGPTGNTIWNNAFWQSGKQDGSLFLDGANDYVNLGSPETLSATPRNRWTIVAWAHPRNLSKTENIIRKNSAGDAYYLRLSGNGDLQSLLAWDDNTFDERKAGSFMADTWQQVAVVYNGTHRIHYVNGEVVGVWNEGKRLSFAANEIVAIGRNSGSDGEYWNGTVDDIRVYDGALATQQIQALHNATR